MCGVAILCEAPRSWRYKSFESSVLQFIFQTNLREHSAQRIAQLVAKTVDFRVISILEPVERVFADVERITAFRSVSRFNGRFD